MIVAVLVVGVLSTTAHDMHVERLTAEGRVLGRVVYTLGRAVEEYRGIPFAEPPIGHLRFRPPRPKTAWEGTLNATGRLTACHQVRKYSPMVDIEFTFFICEHGVFIILIATTEGKRPLSCFFVCFFLK